MLFPDVDDSQALARNMAYVQQAKNQRFQDTLTRMAQTAQGTPNGGPAPMIGGPTPDPNWDAFFGSLQDAKERANDNGMNFKVKTPASIAGLQTAMHGVSPMDAQYSENPLNPLNSQYDLNTQAATAAAQARRK